MVDVVGKGAVVGIALTLLGAATAWVVPSGGTVSVLRTIEAVKAATTNAPAPAYIHQRRFELAADRCSHGMCSNRSSSPVLSGLWGVVIPRPYEMSRAVSRGAFLVPRAIEPIDKALFDYPDVSMPYLVLHIHI